MSAHRDLAVLDAAVQLADEVIRVIDHAPQRLLHVRQMLESAQSIGANISEGYGRNSRPERNQFLRIARGSSEETIRHLASNYRADRIDQATYWRLRNRLVTISKMLESLSRT